MDPHGKAWFRRAFEELGARKREHERVLWASLEADERLVALTVSARLATMVTDRRLVVVTARGPGPNAEAFVESFAFDEIEGWYLGWRHDERPFVVLRHAPRPRAEHVPAHRFLWFAWGNATALVPRGETTVGFPRKRDPALCALVGELRRRRIAEEPERIERPPGTRAERVAGHRGAPLRRVRHPRLHAFRWAIRDAADTLYVGRLSWHVRLICWVVAGGLAALVSPWLVLPAIVLTEIVWMAALQSGSNLGSRRTTVLVVLVGVLSLVGFVIAAALGPSRMVVYGTGDRLERVAQDVTRALGAGHIDGRHASFCTVPSAAAWAVADAAFLVVALIGLVLVVADIWRRETGALMPPYLRRFVPSSRPKGLSAPGPQA